MNKTWSKHIDGLRLISEAKSYVLWILTWLYVCVQAVPTTITS